MHILDKPRYNSYIMELDVHLNILNICESQHLPDKFPWPGNLSAQAALIIAAGQMEIPVRDIILRRLATRPITEDFSAAELRNNVYMLEILEHKKNTLPNPALAFAIGLCISRLHKKIEQIQSKVFQSIGFHDNFLAVRRARKQGLHISLEQSEQIFQALKQSPTPNITMVNLGDVLTQKALVPIKMLLNNAGVFQHVYPRLSVHTQLQFHDPHEILLFIAGKVFDRITTSSAWNSDFFAPQASQINMQRELAHIATDVYALQSIWQQLNTMDKTIAENFKNRQDDLVSVWHKLCQRVEAFSSIANVLDKAEEELSFLRTSEQSQQLHSHIDALLARQSVHEDKLDTAERISAQFSAGRNQLEQYRIALQGRITELIDVRSS